MPVAQYVKRKARRCKTYPLPLRLDCVFTSMAELHETKLKQQKYVKELWLTDFLKKKKNILKILQLLDRQFRSLSNMI